MLTSDQVVLSFSCLHEQSRPGRHLNGLELIVFHILESALLLRFTIIILYECNKIIFCVKPLRYTIAGGIKVSIMKWCNK